MASLDDAKEFEEALRLVREKASSQNIYAIIDRNSHLEEENGQLKVVNSFHEGKLRALQAELDGANKKLDDNTKHISDIRGTLKAKDGKIRELESALRAEKKITEDRNAIKQQLELVTNRLSSTTLQLQELQSFTPNMTPLSEEDITTRCHSLYTQARRLAETYFAVKFSPEVLKNASLWSKLKGHKLVQAAIPVPSTNSSAAMLMRVAAFLAVLSSELCEHVFQSTYFLDDASDLGGLSKVLSHLAKEDPPRERFLRSALLAAIPQDQQELKARNRVETAVHNVSTGVKGLFSSAKQKDSFESQLEDLCKQACEHWQHIQRGEKNVMPILDLYEWQNWRMLEAELPSSSTSTTRQQAGGATGGRTNGKSPVTERQHANVAHDMARGVVWPSFFITDSGRVTVLEGYGIFDSQTKTAKSEIPGPHREARENERKSIAIPMATKRDDIDAKGAFLLQGGRGQNGV
ncbi:hypothetical protein MFIFM68171_00127 [Madurella fahalii]|uniref:Uncharacterized protein n=1 Tax=Madurella fahalii TaxID=1157608 RepID=A0ABQ0FWN3_9PEZI